MSEKLGFIVVKFLFFAPKGRSAGKILRLGEGTRTLSAIGIVFLVMEPKVAQWVKVELIELKPIVGCMFLRADIRDARSC